MSGATEEYPSPPAQSPPAAIRWQSWPLRDHVLRTALVAIGLLAIGVMVGWLTGRVYLAVLAVAALAATAWRLFVPVVFEVSEAGIDRWVFGRRRHIPWEAIHRHEVGPDGILLFSDDDRSPLRHLRALHVPWGTHADEVLTKLRHYRPGQE